MDIEARRIIEALRSGVSSRTASQYFSSARPEILQEIRDSLQVVVETQSSGGMILTGKYGEGKTHLLNTVFNIAHENNMVVSLVSLSKETPFDKLYLVYQKLMANTFLPKRLQPGFKHALEGLSPRHPLAEELLDYSEKQLEVNKLNYLVKSYLETEDYDERFMLLADLEGDFLANASLKQIYKRLYAEKALYNSSFNKSKHALDYMAFCSHLFLKLGYKGWVILFDEAELVGRLSKKARLNAYANMGEFLFPGQARAFSRLEATYSLFAFGASYIEDVIEAKHEYENLQNTDLLSMETQDKVQRVLDAISSASQLKPLSQEEVFSIVEKVQTFHARAYDWNPTADMKELLSLSDKKGYLLRTRIRAAVELLDQLYQYGQAGEIQIQELGETQYEEDSSGRTE